MVGVELLLGLALANPLLQAGEGFAVAFDEASGQEILQTNRKSCHSMKVAIHRRLECIDGDNFVARVACLVQKIELGLRDHAGG